MAKKLSCIYDFENCAQLIPYLQIPAKETERNYKAKLILENGLVNLPEPLKVMACQSHVWFIAQFIKIWFILQPLIYIICTC